MTRHESTPLVAGVDAGGSKTIAWIDHPRPFRPQSDDRTTDLVRPLAEGIGGTGNPRVGGYEAAANEIEYAVRQALSTPNVTTESATTRLTRVCVGAAGAGRREEQKHLAAILSKRFPGTAIIVTDDAVPVLAAASPTATGMILISGTGSFAWARNSSGADARAGGWGVVIGDPGSGYALAIAGLDAVARAVDGRGPETTLLTSFCDRFAVKDPMRLIDHVYAPSMTRREIAKQSRLVIAAAETGDSVAREIVESAAEELARHVRTLARRLNLSAGITLALSGGVLVNEPLLREQLLERIDCLQLKTRLVDAPVAGALVLANRPDLIEILQNRLVSATSM
ncbi:N-acetylglucosamine kinase [Roseiconus lacunae]|uniref:BadF/BadG/BcrA/BcrD ATPase family protein n=1 Tax=Roseiconus lacunae TaxID=2605694 RepID=A0ABT7PKJ5_9BACT|nr:BadF/BadG/BcrA/BcrD ATPase family protein [Roseiconus lacunae]MDM4017001.1 BadF/BadG/BcrA/BcrD ATPase family protein [Roseiconus lacunae]